MIDAFKNPANTRLLLTYDPFSPCDADPAGKVRQTLVDAIVSSVHDNGPEPDYLVENLVEEDDLSAGEIDWFLPVSRLMFGNELNDDSLREHECLEDDAVITDEMRIRHGLAVIEHLLDDGLEGDQPAASAVSICDTRGRSCLVAFEVEGYSFSGINIETVGAFRDEKEIHQWYRSNGYLISHDDLPGARKRILANWEYHKPTSIRSRSNCSGGLVVDLNDWRRLSK